MTYIWTLAADTDDGLLTSVHPTEMEADGAARELIEECWTRFRGTDMPLNHWDAYEIMNEGAGFMDTIQIDKHKLMIPAPVAARQFVYELRAWCRDLADNTIESFETAEMRDEHVQGIEAARNGEKLELGWGIYCRPVVGGVGGIRELEHIADFCHEDEARLVMGLIDHSAAQKPLVVVTVTGGVAEIDSDTPDKVLWIKYDFDENDVSETDVVVMPELSNGSYDWAAIRREAEAQEA